MKYFLMATVAFIAIMCSVTITAVFGIPGLWILPHSILCGIACAHIEQNR